MLSRIKEKNRKVEMCLMMCVMHCLIKTSKLLIDDVSCNVEKMIYFLMWLVHSAHKCLDIYLLVITTGL
jgi:hypothetical protein